MQRNPTRQTFVIMKTRFLFIILFAASALMSEAQDLTCYKKLVKTLCSAKYQGRGYALGGANKAGIFLEKEYRKAGVDEVIRQPFTLDINTFGKANNVGGYFTVMWKQGCLRSYLMQQRPLLRMSFSTSLNTHFKVSLLTCRREGPEGSSIVL